MMRPAFLLRGAAAAVLSLVAALAAAQVQDTVRSFKYDAMGNLKQAKDALGHGVDYTYDEHGRRDTSAPIGLPADITRYAYDGLDNVKKVTDARSVVTSYVIDGLGNLERTTSADTGVTINLYDDAGNITSRQDAKGQLTGYKYDAIGRLKLITHADTSTVAYTYDVGANAKGRLSDITDSSGVIKYAYDLHGRVTSETRTLAGATYVTGYRYDTAGRLSGIDYPTGRSINYVPDSVGRISKVTTTKAGVTLPVLTQVSYEPFGPVKSLTFSNGRTQARTHDLDGRVATFGLAAQTMKVTYDAASRIKGIADVANLATGNTYDYDVQDRLTKFMTPTLGQSFDYDAVGNRTKKTINAATSINVYGGPGNRLTAVGAQAITSDLNGSITNKGNATFNYDARGRMVSATTAIGLVTYTINSLGQRVRKVTPTESTVFHYDLAGKLIAETTTVSGATKTQEYIYLGDMPVAVLK